MGLGVARHLMSKLQCTRQPAKRLFTTVTAGHLRKLESIVGAQHVLTDADSASRYGTDWLQQICCAPAAVVRPSSTEEVAACLRLCAEQGIAVVPHGGNTGLVGGSVPSLGCEVVLSLERMNRVLSFDPDSCIVRTEAGVTLEALDTWLTLHHGYAVPLDLGAKGSCQIGGNVSTAAAGLRFVRYGSLKGSVTGLTAVTGTGQVLDMMSAHRKDNVGYDLKQLYIGSEGTLGVVTHVALQAVPKPPMPQVAMLGVSSWQQVIAAARLVRGNEGLGEVLSAMEYVDGTAMRVSGEALGRPSPPLATETGEHYPYYMLLEAAGAVPEHDTEKMNRLLDSLLAKGLVDDGVLASSASQARSLWRCREETPVGLAKRGWVFKYDISLSLPDFPRLVAQAGERLAQAGIPTEGPHGVFAVGYGHLADGNIHLNVSTAVPPASTTTTTSGTAGRAMRVPPAAEQAALEPWVYQWVLERAGSISAEHGLGASKAKWLRAARGREQQELMRQIKALFDPRGIINPGKVLVE